MNYYYADTNNQSVGPISEVQLHELFRSGLLNPESFVIAEGETEWLQYKTLPSGSVSIPPPLPSHGPAVSGQAIPQTLHDNFNQSPRITGLASQHDSGFVSPLLRSLWKRVPWVVGWLLVPLGWTMFWWIVRIVWSYSPNPAFSGSSPDWEDVLCVGITSLAVVGAIVGGIWIGGAVWEVMARRSVSVKVATLTVTVFAWALLYCILLVVMSMIFDDNLSQSNLDAVGQVLGPCAVIAIIRSVIWVNDLRRAK